MTIGLSPDAIDQAAGRPSQRTLGAACDHLLSTQGKQLRSLTVLEAARMGPRPSEPAVEMAAAVVEILHLATLAHDDVVDDGRLRRALPTVGVTLGNKASGFSGGWLFARALEIVTRCGRTAVSLFSRAASELCEGEMLEVADLLNPDRTRERYLRAIKGKTASLFALSACLGGQLAGANPQLVERLRCYGIQLGLAFQIADDVLDLLVDEAKLGKPRGGDIRNGVYTLPVLYALEENPELHNRLLDPTANDDLESTIALVTSTAGVSRAVDECSRRVRAAKAAIGEGPEGAELRRLVDRAVSPLWTHVAE
jgi:heptaprenyl diphosphate synthase